MNASGNRIGGYGTKVERSKVKCTNKPRRTVKVVKKQDALDMMFAAIYELLEAQRLANTGKKDLHEHVIAMRKLLRYVERRVKETAKKDGLKSSQRKITRS